MIILVDQDDTLADFDGRFFELWRARYPEQPFVPVDERTAFFLRDNYPDHLNDQVESIYTAPGFFRNLAPVPGGLEAVRQMMALGHEVYICTSSINQYENCVLEKFEWIEQFLGREFIRRIVLTHDKTLVRGRLLIDDRPEIPGAAVPEWEHIVFDRPYNRQVTGKRRIDWSNWREVLGL